MRRPSNFGASRRPPKIFTPVSLLLLLCAGMLLQSCTAAENGRKRGRSSAKENKIDSDICSRLVDQIYRGRVTTAPPSRLIGLWTSQRCEVRPGPEYILRQYHFHNASNFQARQFYYADADCAIPSYSLTAIGTYRIRSESWTVPGATELDYQVNHVSIVPYTQMTADILRSTINASCPMHGAVSWTPNRRYDLYTPLDLQELGQDNPSDLDEYVFVDKDCTTDLYFSLHELQLMRLEQRHHHHSNGLLLYLGDVHTDRQQRPIYRPTSYQDPLLEPQAHGCSVCQAVATSGEFSPPTLKKKRMPKIDLTGEWFSESCESRPNSMFLTRRLIFSEDKQSWRGFYYHYSDELCRHPQFTINAKGTYERGSPSGEVQYAHEFNFRVNGVSITPDDESVVDSLNSPMQYGHPCGKEKWKRGLDQDITSTGGCPMLGILVPHVEYELVKMEKHRHHFRLYLGQRPTGDSPSSPNTRPTSFQPPLVRCARAMNFTPPVTPRSKLNNRSSASDLTSSMFLSLISVFVAKAVHCVYV